MSSPALKITAGVAGGYLLGRRRKMRLAVGLGAYLLGKKITTSPTALLGSAFKSLQELPEFAELGDAVRGELATAGRNAAGGVLSQRLESLSDALADRARALEDGQRDEDDAERDEVDDRDRDEVDDRDRERDDVDDRERDEDDEPERERDEYDEYDDEDPEEIDLRDEPRDEDGDGADSGRDRDEERGSGTKRSGSRRRREPAQR